MLRKATSRPASSVEAQDTFPLTSRLRRIIQAEQVGHMIADNCIKVEARNGSVRMPGTQHYYSTDQESVWFIDTDVRHFKDFTEGSLSMLYRALLKDGDKPCVPVGNGLPGMQRGGFKLTSLGRLIVQCCNQYREEWTAAYANQIFDPVTTVMLRAMQRYAMPVSEWGSLGATQVPELARLLERLGRFVRRACGSWRFSRALMAQERLAQDNFDSAAGLILDLANKHSRLLNLRADLYCDPAWDNDRVVTEINRFLRWLRSKACRRNLLPGYLGFIIKCENGLVRGIHWHLMVICDGNRQQKGGYLTEKLGEMWARRTGQGPGSYYNCWADREKYERDGLGVLELGDRERMIGLRMALFYLTKRDCVLKVPGDIVQVFRRSEIKKGGGGRGRPRTRGDSVQLLERMLGGKRSKYPVGLEPSRRKRLISG